jgi:hypothetical protein
MVRGHGDPKAACPMGRAHCREHGERRCNFGERAPHINMPAVLAVPGSASRQSVLHGGGNVIPRAKK